MRRPAGIALAVLALAAFAALLPLGASASEDKKKKEDFDDVRIKGCVAFSEKELLSTAGLTRPSKLQMFRKHFTIKRSDVETGAVDIQLFYQRNGYFEAKAALSEDSVETAEILVTEGPPTKITAVTLGVDPENAPTGGVAVQSLLTTIPLKKGETFTVQAYEDAQKAVARAFKDKGFPFAETKAEASVDLESHTVSVRLTAVPKGLAVFGPVKVKGVQHTEELIVQRALEFTEGELYDQSLVDESQKKLLALGLYDFVNVFPKTLISGEDPTKPGVVQMVARVREGRHHRVRVGLGYGTYEEVRWQLNWETLRVNDHVLTLGTSVKSSAIETNATGYLKRPFFLSGANTLLSDVTYGRTEYPDFTFQSLWGRLGVQHDFTDRLKGGLFVRGERVTNVSPDRILAKSVPPSTVAPATFASLEGSLTWRTTDDLLAPTKGFLVNLAAEPAQDFTNSVQFTKASVEGRLYRSLGSEVVFALRLKIGAILTGGKPSQIHVAKRFYAGGQGSVRGYGYNVLGPISSKGALLGGDGLLESSAEVRFPLKGDLKGLVFIDAGNAFRNPWRYPAQDIYYGAGFGLRYKTPVGPVGIDIAWKLKDYPLESSPYQFYFFIGYAF